MKVLNVVSSHSFYNNFHSFRIHSSIACQKIKESINFLNRLPLLPARWSSGKAFVSGSRGLKFKPRAGQIGISVATVASAEHFLETK